MSDEEQTESGLVQRLSPALSGKQRRYLRGLAHSLKPIVQVGHKGLSPGLVDSLSAALLTHELVKVKVHEGEDIEEVASGLASGADAQLAQKIGHILLFYRARPKKPTIVLPKP